MTQNQLSNLLLDQSKDLFWMINLDFQLIYANKSYQTIVKMVTGQEHKLYESAFVEDFGDISIEKWKTYYSRALKGEYFQVEEHFFHPELNDIQYSQITLEPLREDDKNIFAVVCQSKKITCKEKQKSETIQMIDASLDVFFTNNEEKNLGYFNAATAKLYEYLPEELIGIANKELAFQNEEKEKRAAELGIANKELAFQNKEKEKRAAELGIANKELAFQNEEKEKRAAELSIANKELAFQNEEKEKRAAELSIANKELAFQNEEKEKRAAELVIANKELVFQNDEKEKRAIELGIANKELAFQNDEKEKRAAELSIANKELAFQNEEKEKRAAELGIANKELAFQNDEKEKRAIELGIANKELAFQNEEKEKRAAELVIANKELIFQNDEKEKRAIELCIANKELAFQNDEKEKRAAELSIANKELAFQNDEKEKRAIELGIANKELAFQNEEKEKRAAELDVLNKSLQQYTVELKRSNEELEQFAFAASHDLQEPLRMISSFMDLLRRRYGDKIDEKGHQYIDFATDGAKRMKRIILDLLEYSRTNSPTKGKEEVNINEVFLDFKQLRRKLISEKNATIKSKHLPTLNNYRAAITQILHSLLDNALKYSLEGTPPLIEISVAANETEWEFSIKDNGIGIEPQFYNKIFVIFQRLHNKEAYSGTGIGLSITKRYVEFLGGRIWLESVLEEGTVFYFTIPKN